MFSLNPVWRCVTLIADAVADMPWSEWRGDRRIDPPSRLVRRPFALKTRRWWTWRIVATLALHNTAYVLHIDGEDQDGPRSLLPLPPATIQPVLPDPWGLIDPLAYTIVGRYTPAEYVTLITRAPMPGIPYNLAGLIDLARRQFTAYLAADMHMSRYWQAGGTPTAVITSDQRLEDPDAERIAQRWVDRRARGTEWPAVFGQGAEAHPWGADPTTESATEARRELTAEVGRYFGVPTRILNAPAGDSETYSNVENDAIDLWRYTLRGYAGPIEDAISELLPGDYITGRRMELDPARWLQGNLNDRATAWAALKNAAIVSVDEARVRGFGLPARGGAADELTANTSTGITAVTADAGGAPATVTVGG